MLTGHRAFGTQDDSITDYLVAVVTKEPDWTLLPAGTPARLVRLLKHCLKKDARERLRDIGDARLELTSDDDHRFQPAPAATARAATARAIWFVAGVAVAAAAIGAAWLTLRGDASAPPAQARFAIAIRTVRNFSAWTCRTTGSNSST